ncbi:MAG: cob(I)yrinic acid a,c-diamide adenosyltransferase [Myxococcales bacterium]|nr:cob(I)yrinic acid a,c-diamide adenosyltransferase [Myxococcales bacterium]
MVRLTRIYTRTGDDGSTALVGGERVGKDDLRIEAYGTVDELNATLGMVRERNLATGSDAQAQQQLEELFSGIQQQLFNLGSSLATRTESRWEGQPVISADDVAGLESALDEMNAELPKLKSFILPGGGPVGSTLHLSRTVCRRAERCVVRLAAVEPVEPADLHYLNRLSDLLFVAGRWVAKRHGEKEILWTP